MKNAACPLTPDQADRRGIAWVVGSFVLCPCHLPITLGVIAAVLSGTALGVLVRSHIYLAGAIISITWLAGTLHGFNLMRRARIDSYLNRPAQGFLKEERHDS